jgi:two-component system cell cycle response regulator
VRSMDVVARFGGDEFMVILPETPASPAIDIAGRLRDVFANGAALPGGAVCDGPYALTISIGIVCYPEHGQTLELLLENVDKALYRAKHKGKNTMEVFS